MPIEQAKAQGAMALFGEKYPEIVRVVRMGDFSRELCGGTHLESVGQVGLFKVVGEESVAAGVRRITALTGKAALEYVRQEEEILGDLAATLRVPPGQVGQRVAALLEEIKTLKKQASQRPREAGAGVSADDLLAEAHAIAGAAVVVRAVGGSSADEMRQLVDVLRRKRPGTPGGPPDLDGRREGPARRRAVAATWSTPGCTRATGSRKWRPIVGGGGGGRPDLAQAGGKVPDQVPAALAKAVEVIRARLGG